MDSAGVMQEVEALFKKLEDLPDNVRQKALTTIHERLPTFSPTENIDSSDARPKLKRGRPRKRSTTEHETAVRDATVKSLINEWSDDDEIVVNAVQTSRGRNTKRISIASLMKSGRRSNSYPSGNRKKSSRKKAKVEDTRMVPVIKMELLNEGEADDNDCGDAKPDFLVAVKEEVASDIEADENDIAVEEGFENDAPSENIENINRKESHRNEGTKSQQRSQVGTSRKEKASPVKRGLSIQNRAHRTITSTGKTVYKCPECGKLFAQSSGLHLHLKRHRGERDYPCSDCPYRAFTRVDLSRHVTIHTGERNHICQYCGKAYAKDSTLRDHVISMHERKVKHVCGECGFSTHRANNLRVHVRMRHHGEYNNHVCPVCQASIKQKSAFLEHMRSHTGERPFQCDRCPAAFACTARLNVHRNSVHGERQFQCEQCKKCFQTKHHLLRHEAVHTKARPYACPFCSYACNTQGNMAKHVRTIHNMPDYSYRKFKELQENGGQPRPLDPDWVEKGNKLTEQYLKELSEKLGRPVTIEELWKRQEEVRLQKLNRATKDRSSRNGSEHSYHSKTLRGKPVELRPAGESSEVEPSCDDPSVTEEPGDGGEGLEKETQVEEEEEEEERHPSVFNWLSNNGNIQLCLETKELQVYTGDATREPNRPDGLEETIQGYMNEEGHFIRFNDDVVVNDDDSTVVVIINSEDMQEAVVQPQVAVDEPSELRVTPISENPVYDASQHANQRIILVQES